MFQAAHITLIQTYPFLEPVFAPQRLRGVARWPILRDQREESEYHRDPDIFNYLPALRKWLREGYRIQVPNYGSMKALRKAFSTYDSFYEPFLRSGSFRDRHVDLPENRERNGPLPFFPIQVMMTERELSLRHDEAEADWFQSWLGSAPRGWVVKPMLMVYPAGAISAQFRLYVEPKAALGVEQVESLLTGFNNWPWALVRPDGSVAARDHGVANLLDEMVRRFLSEILDESVSMPERQPETMTLINLQGSPPKDDGGAFAPEVADALYTLTRVKRSDLSRWMIGERRHPQEPWLVVGRERITLLLDDAVRAHTHYRTDGRILDGRRAMRNRAISVVEMALISHMLFEVYGAYFEDEVQFWEVDALRSTLKRVRTAFAGPQINDRIWTTFFYELAMVMRALAAADERNKDLWEALFQVVQLRAEGRGSTVLASLEVAVEYGQRLIAEKRAHSERQWRILVKTVDYLIEIVGALIQRT